MPHLLLLRCDVYNRPLGLNSASYLFRGNKSSTGLPGWVLGRARLRVSFPSTVILYDSYAPSCDVGFRVHVEIDAFRIFGI